MMLRNRYQRLLVLAWAISTAAMGRAHSADQVSARQDLTAIPFETLLEIEVITASRMASQVSDSPSAVSIVTSQDIHDYGYRTLAEILNSMRGLYTSNDRIYDYLGGRGYGRPGDYTGRIMLLIDGVQANDNLYNQAFLGTDGMLDTALIDRVEYVSGPGSVSYGNNAFFGIINVITKKGRDIGGTQLSAGVGSYGGREGRITFGKQLDNGVDLLLSGSGLNSRGRDLYFAEFDSPATNNGVAQHLDGQHNRRLFGKLGTESWQLEAGYVDRLKNVPTAAFGGDFNARPSYYEDASKFISFNRHQDLSEHLKMSFKVNYGDYAYHEKGMFGGSLYSEGSIGRWYGANATFVGNWFTDHTLVFGAEYRNDYKRKVSTPAASPDVDMQTLGVFVQDEIALRTNLKLNVGGRYDQATEGSGHFSPRVALLYEPWRETSLKLSYSNAFRLPNAFERYYTDLSTILPNPKLRNETINSVELVAEKRWGSRARIMASLYHQQTDRFIQSLPDPGTPGATTMFNTSGGDVTGMEFEAERHWDNGIRFRGSYAYQASYDMNDAWAVNSPRHLGKLNLTGPLFSNALRAGVELQAMSNRRTEAGNNAAGFALANLTLSSQRLLPNFDTRFTVRNLFDRDYVHVAPSANAPLDTIVQDGRSYWLNLEYTLK